MAKKKTAEVRLAEAIKELGIIKATSIFQVLKSYSEDAPARRERKPKEKVAAE